jgi:hypothetical protein
MAKKKNPYAGLTADQIIAASEGDVRYGPQISQIRDLYRQAAKQKKSDIGAARETAASAIAYANAQRPTVKNVYARGVEQANKTATGINAVLTRSLGADSPYAAEIAAETGGSKNRINEAKIGALTDLTNRATGAAAGRALAINQARAAYGENKRTLGTKLTDLLGEKGAYVAGRYATLGAEAADRKAAGNRANTVITSGALAGRTQNWAKNHPQQAQDLVDKWNAAHPAGGKGGAGGDRTAGQIKDAGTFADQVKAAQRWVRKIHTNPALSAPPQKGVPGVHAARPAGPFYGKTAKQIRQMIGDELLAGSTPTGKTEEGTYEPGHPGFGQLALGIALDQHFDKHISRGYTKALHKRKIKVADLNGVTPYSEWQSKQQRGVSGLARSLWG